MINELRGSMYSLLDAFKGDYTQQAAHYEQRMRQLQDTLHSQVAATCPVQAAFEQQPGMWLHSVSSFEQPPGMWQHSFCSLAAQCSGLSRLS